MASFITAGNATNGLQVSSDNTGILELKSGTGSGTTAVTVNASQNVGFGTTSPTSKVQVVGSILATGAASALRVNEDGAGTKVISVRSDFAGVGPTINVQTNDPLLFATNNTERVRIDSSGNLLVGTTSATLNDGGLRALPTGSGSSMLLNVSNTGGGLALALNTTANTNIAQFFRSNTAVGTISVTTTATAYNTSSDYRLKENVQPMTGALAKVAALKPCTYTWKIDGELGEGFIAHELAEVVPDAVTGEKDAVDEDGNIKPQGIDTSFLVATLTAAIQELKAELDEMKAEIAALKGAA